MNWTKAKTILIIALLATNIFLIGSHWNRHHSNSGDLANEAILFQMLADRGITLETTVPKNRVSMPVLHGEYVDLEEADIQALLKQDLATESDSDMAYREVAEEFITYLGLMCDSLKFESIERDGNEVKVCFGNNVNGLYVAGNYMTCIFKNQTLKDFSYLWLMPTRATGRKAEIVSAATALMTLDNEENAMEITDIELVYWVPESDEVNVDSAVSDTAFPTWRIMTSEGQTIYIEAV